MPFHNLTETEIRRREAAHEERELAIQSTFPVQLKLLVAGARVSAFPLNGKKIAAECEKHSSEVSALAEEAKTAIDQLRESLSAADESGNFGEVFMHIEQCRFDKSALSEKAVALCAASAELAERVYLELKPLPDKLAATAEDIVVEVKRQLTEIGSGVENLPASRDNVRAGERQFDFQTRNWNGRARDALKLAKDARGYVEAATGQVRKTTSCLRDCKAFLRKHVVAQINS